MSHPMYLPWWIWFLVLIGILGYIKVSFTKKVNKDIQFEIDNPEEKVDTKLSFTEIMAILTFFIISIYGVGLDLISNYQISDIFPFTFMVIGIAFCLHYASSLISKSFYT